MVSVLLPISLVLFSSCLKDSITNSGSLKVPTRRSVQVAAGSQPPRIVSAVNGAAVNSPNRQAVVDLSIGIKMIRGTGKDGDPLYIGIEQSERGEVFFRVKVEEALLICNAPDFISVDAASLAISINEGAPGGIYNFECQFKFPNGLAFETISIVVEVFASEDNQQAPAPDPSDIVPVTIGFVQPRSYANESASNHSIAVSIGAAQGDILSVSYSVTGGTASGGGVDFTLANGTLDFQPGETKKHINVAIINDGSPDDQENIEITLATPIGGQLGTSQHELTIYEQQHAIRKVVGGLQFMCVLYTNGKVKCWGRNEHGQLGQESSADDLGASANEMSTLANINLGTGRKAIDIAAGSATTACAILENHQLKCWGGNENGELGQGDTTNRGDNVDEMGDLLSAIDLGSNLSARQVALGNDHVCALRSDQSVVCWGLGNQGQLGNDTSSTIGNNLGEMGDNLIAVLLPTGRKALKIGAGGDTSCALLDDHQLFCWGDGANGRRGDGDVSDKGYALGHMASLAPLNLGSNLFVTNFSMQHGHSCALLSSGMAKCWGSNDHGALGQGDTADRGDGAGEMGVNLIAIDYGSNLTPIEIGVGQWHTCTLFSNGKIKCMGLNSDGQLGIESTSQRGSQSSHMGENLAFVDLGAGVTVRSLAVGGLNSCAVVDDGQVVCWGANNHGQLGIESSLNKGDNSGEMGSNIIDSLLAINPAKATLDITLGEQHGCALSADSRIKCWGRAQSGTLGQGNETDLGDDAGEMGSNLPYIDLGSGQKIRKISAGFRHNCAILMAGEVKCWGRNNKGQLGIGTNGHVGEDPDEMGENMTVVDLGTNKEAIALSLGKEHSCALLQDHSVKCWGANTYGQLGLGNSSSGEGDDPGEMGDNLLTVDLGNGMKAVSLMARSDGHSCVILQNSQVKCWGNNSNGQLGLGDAANRGDDSNEMGGDLPTIDLGSDRFAIGLVSGNDATCSVLNQGDVKCWGNNDNGAAGQDSEDPAFGDASGEMGANLATINLGSKATFITHGRNFACALLENSDLKCWGQSWEGQLGHENTSSIGDFAGEMAALSATPVGTGTKILKVNSNNDSTCVLTIAGSVKCWGDGSYGRLGQERDFNIGDHANEMGDYLPETLIW